MSGSNKSHSHYVKGASFQLAERFAARTTRARRQTNPLEYTRQGRGALKVRIND